MKMKKFRVTIEFTGSADYEIDAENEAAVRELFDKHGSFDHLANRFNDHVDEEIAVIEEMLPENKSRVFRFETSEMVRRCYRIEFPTDNKDEALQMWCDMDEEDKVNSMIWDDNDGEQLDVFVEIEKE